MNLPSPAFASAFAAALALAAFDAHAFEAYGGGGTTGVELGLAQPLGDRFSARVDYNRLRYRYDLKTSDIDYDARFRMSTVGAYLDGFVASGFRLTGGAVIGSRKLHGTARGVGNTITFNGVVYPIVAGDTLDFDAEFPRVSPYLGIGWGHRGDTRGWKLYADAGVVWGRPDVRLSPSASLASKVSPSDLAGEQASAQDKANDYRAYPVVKLGIAYSF